MKNETKKSTDAKLIRQKADELLKEKQSNKSVSLTELKSIKLVHELKGCQIELEMQKNEMELAKEKAEINATKYRNLYDYAPTAYFTIKSDGEICELNFNAAKMLNNERSNLINNNFKLFISSETRSLFVEFLDRVSVAKTKQDCEVRLVINEKLSAFVHIEGILLENEKNYLLTVIDISKRKHAEIEQIKTTEKAVLSEKYLDNIINNIGDPFFVKDEQSRILLVNDAFCVLFDLTRDNIIGKTLAEDVPLEERDAFLKIDRHVLRTGQENIIEESLTVRGGQTKTISTRKTRYVDSNDKKYLIGVIRDLTERKIAEERLKESMSQNELAVDISKLGVYELRIDSGELLWNDRHLEFYGIKREEFTNDIEGWRSQLHPDDKKYAETRFQEVFERKSLYDLDFRIIRPNGDIRYLSAAAAPIVIDDKLVKVIGVNRDITEIKEYEKELKESEREHKSLIAKMMNAFALHEIIYNAEGDAIDYKFLQVNPAWEKIVGTKSEMVVGKPVREMIPSVREIIPSIDDVWIKRYNRIVETGVSEEFEEYSVALEKYFYCYAYRTGPGKFAVIFNDTTEKKKAEKKVKESDERIRLFTQNIPDFLLQIDRTGEINYINKTLEGLTQKDVIGSSVYSWIPEGFSEEFKDKVEKVFSDGGSQIMEYPGNGLKGEPLWFESKIGPFEKSGIITQVIIVSRDITERKRTELNLERALDEIIELEQRLEAENIYLKEELKLNGNYEEIIGSNKSLVKVLKQVEQVAKTDTTVLILGETGTGKELIAKAIHNASDRKNKSFIKVNCAALPSELIESELFGHEKGAFTGALKCKIGRFELANGGTIFLDEIGDLPISLQSRLLRVLQESEFERVGGETTIKVDIRVISASNRNLKERILEDNFRQDLYYRLNVFPITCPPLRDRMDDIPSLVNHFVNKYNHKVSDKIKKVHQKTIERLMKYKWPGNIRELEHVIERALITNQGDQLRLGSWFLENGAHVVIPDELTTLEVMDRDYIIRVLEKTNWKIRGKNGAAEILGLKPTTLESRMKKLNINR
jgi:PAS domain S-box-containing protein